MLLLCLIVDDNSGFPQAARTLLERQGLTVVGVASTSAAALRLARELRPDVVLVDILLGRERGLELVSQLPQGADGPTVIVVSTRSSR